MGSIGHSRRVLHGSYLEIWDLSITPVGYFTGAIWKYGIYQSLLWGTSRELSGNMGSISHSRGVLHGSYLKITPVACPDPMGLFFLAKMRYFRATGMIFPRLLLLLDGI
jgi:hypothetical protein